MPRTLRPRVAVEKPAKENAGAKRKTPWRRRADQYQSWGKRVENRETESREGGRLGSEALGVQSLNGYRQ